MIPTLTETPSPATRTLRVGLVTLGCDKNTVDNEYLAGLLEEQGCEVITSRAAAGILDAVVVTTCGFIGDAKQQSIDAIVELAEKKRSEGNPRRRLYVAGCLAQRYADEILAEIPEIDGLVGVGQFKQMAQMIARIPEAENEMKPLATEGPAIGRSAIQDVPQVDIYRLMRRRALDHRPYAFLKISDGCNHTCTFCSIPIMKGKLRSVPPELVLEEARGLLARGVKELNIVAQDLSMYGMDRWREWRLPRLLRDICALPGDFWVRCLYYYPGLVTDEFIETMASEPKIVPYLDMPLQHLNPGVLRRMKRPFHEVNTFKVIERLRAAIPNLTLRTTMIVGFPGETPAEHKKMIEGMETLEFDRLGAFQYSQELDTPAGMMERQVSARTRRKRWEAVMATQAAIAEKLNARRVGERTRVLVESLDPETKLWIARSAAEAPEIDGKVYIESATPLPIGEFIDVRIERAEVYDLYAKRITS